jgi:hypothetical protein
LKNEQAKTVLALDRGAPLFVERAVGEGRVIACATSANAEWSNMPLQMVFVPLVQRLVSYLSAPTTDKSSQLIGSSVQLGLPQGRGDEVFTLTDPSGKTSDLKARKEAHGVVIQSPATSEPGVYELRAKGASDESAHKVAVNVDTSKSELKPLAAAEVKKLAARYEAGYADSLASYQKLDRTRRHGSEVWQAFLLCLLALLFVEVLLEQRIARA